MNAMMNAQNPARRLYRSRTDRQITGLSGGIAKYLDADPSVIRIAWVLAAFFTFPVAPIAYLIVSAVVPNEPIDQPAPVAGDTFAI
jgi:phage shock protein C